jgi:RNA recognition motif-containing protein
MAKKLYVGNLSYGVDDASLHSKFSEFGNVESARVIMDRESGRSKGFGFVEMSSDDEAERAISAMNGQEFDGRAINVSEARPQAPREGGGGRGGGYGGGGGGRGGGGRGGGGGYR